MWTTVFRDGHILIAELSGRLEGSSSIEFQFALEREISSDDKALILDLQDLSFLSSTGLRILAIMSKRTADAGIKFALCAPQNSVNKVITMSGFNKLIRTFGTQAEARNAVTP